jgi:hypothetical protein
VVAKECEYLLLGVWWPFQEEKKADYLRTLNEETHKRSIK